MTGVFGKAFAEALAASGGGAIAAFGQGDDTRARFLSGLGHLSPFLGRALTRDKERLDRILRADHGDGFAALYAEDPGTEKETAKACLRRQRTDVIVAIALADLAGIFSLNDVTGALSRFADWVVSCALATAWEVVNTLRGVGLDPSRPRAGLTFLAMGKHGAGELNYSSDIDLVAIYDPDLIPVAEGSRFDAKGVAMRVVQQVVDILEDQTSDGFVFRTDLRLRPNPSATPIAVSLSAAAQYYEIYGQNWERAAFIKARPCAGDREVAAEFMEMIGAFVWRRTLDFGAVADIYAVKAQIHAERGRPDLEAAGANVKLGPGGIREIEFFVQTQQLLLGGRDPTLRSLRTIDGLRQLTAAGYVDDETCAGMTAAYDFLRRVEHCLQLREDQQTQDLPTEPAELDVIAALSGFAGRDDFLSTLTTHLVFVHDTYADLFHVPNDDGKVDGNLVFTGVDDDPRTLTTLRSMGFASPEFVTERIRRWHRGEIRAARSVRARELLTALVPRILLRLGAGEEPDIAFAALDDFLTALPEGVQTLALFTTYPQVLDELILLCYSAPALSKKLASRPALVEGLLEGVDVSPPDFPEATEWSFEEKLDETRRIVGEHRVRAAAGLILGQMGAETIGGALSATADRAIDYCVDAVTKMAAEEGKLPDGQLAVLGFGRLGLERLTLGSDLDLVFVYRLTEQKAEDEVLFTRLVRRIVTALSVPTAQGDLYKIDMQLRPSGGAGPAAVSINAFRTYYDKTAWVWEEMALTKARIVAGDPSLAEDVTSVIDQHLVKKRDRATVCEAVREMRVRLYNEKAPRTAYDVKRLAGGLTDVEFLAQGISLIHGSALGRLPRRADEIFREVKQAGHLEAETADALASAYLAYDSFVQYARATLGSEPPARIPDGFLQRLSRIEPLWLAGSVDDQLAVHRRAVYSAFSQLIGPYDATLD
ncbi:glutamate-ammonia-ligase adenylyltransferase, putative [Parvularcula bermudensis HTCC2503]|uniref:Glutamate-ammonia-ligase adenylyltransferase, putative n=1 Tax=Parvularcula bermudensis (strain ATCC BAA-594 / HTCC2503 / KCTC 12087) TaxID=314260 RepID=E0TIA3_PARBH|nr:bifunctional [glutamine synthetase] adenylyltransferase/[glutamine synthetase]-adenylyl-L-tyrosine phosphorylase [Parvularcula bermudensis]ADM09687.1 glutamate-ammonia-ligase adenylyltransferase, putative [Parvularcula bermudensis HTCC2503]